MRNPNSIPIQGCGKETPYGRIIMKNKTTCNHELQIGKKTTIENRKETLVNHPNKLELRFHIVFCERRPKLQNSKMNIVTTI